MGGVPTTIPTGGWAPPTTPYTLHLLAVSALLLALAAAFQGIPVAWQSGRSGAARGWCSRPSKACPSSSSLEGRLRTQQPRPRSQGMQWRVPPVAGRRRRPSCRSSGAPREVLLAFSAFAAAYPAPCLWCRCMAVCYQLAWAGEQGAGGARWSFGAVAHLAAPAHLLIHQTIHCCLPATHKFPCEHVRRGAANAGGGPVD